VELIPRDDIQKAQGFNFAPMIDFLFLMLALFATLSISKSTLYDANISLASSNPNESTSPLQASKETEQVHISINAQGQYKWLTEFDEYPMNSAIDVQNELLRQYEIGVLPKTKEKTEVLFHIDKNAPWESIVGLLVSIRELGFTAYPLYQSETTAPNSRR
jgi:biopolymer transport protein ExbD